MSYHTALLLAVPPPAVHTLDRHGPPGHSKVRSCCHHHDHLHDHGSSPLTWLQGLFGLREWLEEGFFPDNWEGPKDSMAVAPSRKRNSGTPSRVSRAGCASQDVSSGSGKGTEADAAWVGLRQRIVGILTCRILQDKVKGLQQKGTSDCAGLLILQAACMTPTSACHVPPLRRRAPHPGAPPRAVPRQHGASHTPPMTMKTWMMTMTRTWRQRTRRGKGMRTARAERHPWGEAGSRWVGGARDVAYKREWGCLPARLPWATTEVELLHPLA